MPDNLRLQVLVEVDAETGELRVLEQGLEDVRHETDRSTESNRRNTRSSREQTTQYRSLRGELAAVTAAAAGLYGVLRGGAAVIETTAQFEQFELRLNVFAETAAEGARNYEELLRYAALTPFSVQGVIDSFLQLESTSFSPQLSDLRALGDIAAATARPLEEFVNALTAAGRSEFDPLEGFGFTIRKENEQIRIEFRDTVRVVEDNRREILQAFVDIARERDEFAGATEILAASLTGALSNLGDSIDQTLVQVGRGGLGSAVSDLARSLSEAAEGGAPLARALGAVAGVGVRLTPLAATIGAIYVQTRLLNGVLAVTPGLVGTTALSVRGLTTSLAGLGATLSRFLGPVGWFVLAAEAVALFAAGQDDAVASTSRLRRELDSLAESRAVAGGTENEGLSGRLRALVAPLLSTDDEATLNRRANSLENEVHRLYDQLVEDTDALRTALENDGPTAPLREDLAETRRALTETVDEYEALLTRLSGGAAPSPLTQAGHAATRLEEIPFIRGAIGNVSTPGRAGAPAGAGTSPAARTLLAEIVGLETSLLPQAEQARRKILDQQAELLASLRELGPGYEEYETRINAVTQALLEQVGAADAAKARLASEKELEAFIELIDKAEQEIAEFERDREARVQGAVEQIVSAGADQFDRARLEAVRWESDMLAILNESEEAWAQWADEVARITEERLAKINEEAAEATEAGTLLAGVEAGLENYLELFGSIQDQARNAVVSSLVEMENALVDFVTTGELNIRNLVDTIIAEFARIVIRQAIIGPLAQGLSGAFGGAGGPISNIFGGLFGGGGGGGGGSFANSIAGAPVFHQGGVAGAGATDWRLVSGAHIAGAARYPSGYGLRPGESLGIFEAGEVILSRDQVAALRGNGGGVPAPAPEVRLNFENRGNPVEPEVQSQRWDGRTLVIDVMLEDMARRGPFSQGLRRTFGLREQSV